MKKIIAVSVYGTNPRYFEGAIKNANIAKILFPDWIYKVYLGSKRPDGFKEKSHMVTDYLARSLTFFRDAKAQCEEVF